MLRIDPHRSDAGIDTALDVGGQAVAYHQSFSPVITRYFPGTAVIIELIRFINADQIGDKYLFKILTDIGTCQSSRLHLGSTVADKIELIFFRKLLHRFQGTGKKIMPHRQVVFISSCHSNRIYRDPVLRKQLGKAAPLPPGSAPFAPIAANTLN